MKIRKFYPRQVLRKLQAGQKQPDAVQAATPAGELASIGREAARAVIANASTRIILKEA